MSIRRRVLALVLCFVLLCAALVACKEEPEMQENADGGGEAPAAEPIAPEELPTTRKLAAFNKHYFAVGDSNTALELMLPSGWRATLGDGLYALYEGETKVGVVCAGEHDANMTLAAEKTASDISVKTYIGKLTRSKVNEPYYQTVYTFRDTVGTERRVLAEIKQSAMDGAAMQWLNRPAAERIKGFGEVPTLRLSEGNGKSKILILGNSFVNPGHSAITDILEDLIAAGSQECTVHWFSLGYATVSKYATDAGTNFANARSHIASGDYNLVLMCGLYGSEDVTALGTIIEACEQAGSRLVLLPAHNEGSKHIESALDRYEGTECLNWKQEIDDLIGSGIERSLFCKSDAHSHSTNLAGYVGAHLIYRALFGELPPTEGYGTDAIVTPTLIAPLGDYVTKGLQRIPKDSIKYL